MGRRSAGRKPDRGRWGWTAINDAAKPPERLNGPSAGGHDGLRQRTSGCRCRPAHRVGCQALLGISVARRWATLGRNLYVSNVLDDLLFDLTPGQDWHMQRSERSALIHILTAIKPDVSIEIGTFRCGSLGPISRSSRNAYTFDIDANQHRAKSQFPNVEFVTGDSAVTLPPVINKLNQSDRELEFILVDGSHEEDGVAADLAECLKYRPKKSPTVIVMHDSCNPAVRRGIGKAPWRDCPYVHQIDLDYIPGMLYDRHDIMGEIWGGLAVAVMLPEPRKGDVDLQSTFEPSRRVLMQHSVYGAE
jgi:hypothetical protein